MISAAFMGALMGVFIGTLVFMYQNKD